MHRLRPVFWHMKLFGRGDKIPFEVDINNASVLAELKVYFAKKGDKCKNFHQKSLKSTKMRPMKC